MKSRTFRGLSIRLVSGIPGIKYTWEVVMSGSTSMICIIFSPKVPVHGRLSYLIRAQSGHRNRYRCLTWMVDRLVTWGLLYDYFRYTCDRRDLVEQSVMTHHREQWYTRVTEASAWAV